MAWGANTDAVFWEYLADGWLWPELLCVLGFMVVFIDWDYVLMLLCMNYDWSCFCLILIYANEFICNFIRNTAFIPAYMNILWLHLLPFPTFQPMPQLPILPLQPPYNHHNQLHRLPIPLAIKLMHFLQLFSHLMSHKQFQLFNLISQVD